MIIYRLTKIKYSKVLNGVGAAKSGNRWNSKGTEIVYCAENRSLALAELAVHLTVATLPGTFMMLEIEVPKTIKIENLSPKILPKNWNAFSHLKTTQTIGDNFVSKAKSCVLKVPSAVVQGDFNYLLNPRHKNFKKIKIKKRVKFPIDERFVFK